MMLHTLADRKLTWDILIASRFSHEHLPSLALAVGYLNYTLVSTIRLKGDFNSPFLIRVL